MTAATPGQLAEAARLCRDPAAPASPTLRTAAWAILMQARGRRISWAGLHRERLRLRRAAA